MSAPPCRVPGPSFRVAGALGLLVLAAMLSGAAAGPPAQGQPASQAQEDAVREIAAQLRCPVCQNLSVADSPSGLANEMRGVIREKLKAGESRQQIEAYFTSKYGEWILLAPMKRGFNLLAWGLPFVGIVAGAIAVMFIARRWAERGGEGAPAPDEAVPAPDPEDAAYRERLRRELEDFAR